MRGETKTDKQVSLNDVYNPTEMMQMLLDNISDYAITMLDMEGKIKTWTGGPTP